MVMNISKLYQYQNNSHTTRYKWVSYKKKLKHFLIYLMFVSAYIYTELIKLRKRTLSKLCCKCAEL